MRTAECWGARSPDGTCRYGSSCQLPQLLWELSSRMQQWWQHQQQWWQHQQQWWQHQHMTSTFVGWHTGHSLFFCIPCLIA